MNRFKVSTLSARHWGPAAGALVVLLASSVFAYSRLSHVSRELLDVAERNATLAESVSRMQGDLLTASQLDELHAHKADLERRADEAEKPGIVVPELTETARSAGLTVREIQPIHSQPQVPGVHVDSPGYPRYRVRLVGNYRQIADYLERCKMLRLPARVSEVRITAAHNDEPSAGPSDLAADITMEVFQAALKPHEEPKTAA